MDWEEVKVKAIDLFLLYKENKKIDELCERIVKEIMEVDGAHDTIIEMKDIIVSSIEKDACE